jgi:DNA-binding transcriptional ArsR family regulator
MPEDAPVIHQVFDANIAGSGLEDTLLQDAAAFKGLAEAEGIFRSMPQPGRRNPKKLRACQQRTFVLLRSMPNYSLDLAFQALADPSRRALVARLSRGPASVGELARPLAMALPSVMQHLRLLEASGLVRSQKLGRVRTCRLQPKALRRVEDWVAQRRAALERKLDRLERYLDAQEDD